MPDSAAPASAAINWPSPVSTLQPSARLRNAQPPVAMTTAPVRATQVSPVWRFTPVAPQTVPCSSTSSSRAGLWSRMRAPDSFTRLRISRMYSGPCSEVQRSVPWSSAGNG